MGCDSWASGADDWPRDLGTLGPSSAARTASHAVVEDESSGGFVKPPKFHPNAIQTYTGLAYDFEKPTPDMICLDDIAHALSNACRFAGHVSRFYSVAEHCVRVSYALEVWYPNSTARLARIGLLHDAHEAYVWDCPRPFKPLFVNAEGVNVYEEFANKADIAIAAKFGAARAEVFHEPPIKRADDCLLVAEAKLLMHHGPEEWASWDERYSKIEDPPPEAWHPSTVGWDPKFAEEAFHHRARELQICD